MSLETKGETAKKMFFKGNENMKKQEKNPLPVANGKEFEWNYYCNIQLGGGWGSWSYGETETQALRRALSILVKDWGNHYDFSQEGATLTVHVYKSQGYERVGVWKDGSSMYGWKEDGTAEPLERPQHYWVYTPISEDGGAVVEKFNPYDERPRCYSDEDELNAKGMLYDTEANDLD